MKKFTFRRAIVSVIAFVLAFSLLSSNLQPIATVYADPASGTTTGGSQKPSGSGQKPSSNKITIAQKQVVQTQLDAMKNQVAQKAQTTQQKSLVEQELELWAKERKEERDKNPNKEKFEAAEQALNIVNDAMPLMINTITDIVDGGDFDTASFVSGVADLACGILACIAPWGTVAAVGLKIAMSIFTACMGGAEAPSETQLMEDRLNQRLDEIADQISEVQDQLSEMSDQINESTEKIIASVSSSVENESDKNHLRDFMLSSGQGDFSYNQLRNYIYGTVDNNSDGMTAYYALLQEAQFNGGSSEEIRHYYDLLYSGLVDNRTSFHHYITGDGFGKSIVQTYYDVLSMRPDLTAEMGKSAEMATVEFACDLYTTEMMMDQLILSCNNYQYMQMLIREEESYDYGTGTVLASDILNDQKQSNIAQSLKIGIDQLRMQFAEDLVSILSITDSFVLMQNGESYYHVTAEVDGVPYAQVLPGQTLYLNNISALVCEQFDLDAEGFRYSGNGMIHEDGIVLVTDANKDAAISLTYTDTDGSDHAMGAIQLIDATDSVFSGGYGTKEAPYLIATAQQLLNIAEEEGMDLHYRLVNDLSFGGEEILPLGCGTNTSDTEVYEEFTGTLDGDGFKIQNVKITGTINSGLFGKIGSQGVVKNLTLSNVEVNVSTSELGKSSATFTGGTLAGINNGTIDSCTVTDSKVIAESNTTNEDAERTVYHKYGGLVGVNAGQIKAVLVKDTTVDAFSHHNFEGASTSSNQNNVFVGGICGTTPGKLDYVGVNAGVTVKAHAKSELNPKSTVNPYLKAYAGGISTQEGLKMENVTNVYSDIKSDNVVAERSLKVNSGWGKHWKNALTAEGNVFPKKKQAEIDKVAVALDKVEGAYFVDEVYNVVLTDKTEKYPVGAVELNDENLELEVNGKTVETFRIMDTYGFSTYNESFDNTTEKTVTAVVEAQVDNQVVMLPATFTITVDTNRVETIRLIDFDDVYFRNGTLPTTATVERTDANGKKTTIDNANITILNADKALSELGTSKIEVEYMGATCTVEVQVLCNIHLTHYNYSNTDNFTFVQSVEASCQHGAYDEYLCHGCGEHIKANITGALSHKLVRDISQSATCARPGVIGKIYCQYCNEVFEEEVELPRLAHTFENAGDANNHTCTACNKSFAHDYVVSESLADGVVTYTYTCYSCGHVGQKNDTNIITNEERLRPAVVVSDGFATNAGDLVTVYVDLENNPGVNGANFGIRYDERLELVNWYEGEFFSATSTEASHAVNCGYNFVWGNEAAKAGKGGNLLELVFRLPYDATTQDSYEVAVVYSVVAGSEGGFALPNDVCATLNIPANRPQKFKTKDGVIRLVDRLPGDVDNSNAVNLRDALYLSNCLVNEEDYPITKEVKQYGDVNLDAMVTINDVVKLLQSISGGYGASLLSPEYRIQLNTNGYAYDPDALFVHLYGANNTYAALADIEAAMMQRQGYKFLGWYTRLEGGVKIDAANYQTQLVSYDQDQKIQTLYAHWQKNSVSFDMNGATSEWLDKETYLGNGAQWITLTAPVEEYTVIFADPNNETNNRKVEKMSRTFAYWQGSDGVKYYAGDKLDVSKLNMGELTLTAVWNEWTLNFPTLEKTGYDANQITWYTNKMTTDELTGNVYETIKAMPNKVLYAKWTAPNTYYVHYDANGGSGTMDDSVYVYDDVKKELAKNGTDEAPAFTRTYTVTFNYGWSGQTNTVVKVSHGFKGWSRDGKTVLSGEDALVKNWTAEQGKVITVYAVWDTQTVELRMPADHTGYTFGGWYLDANITRPAGTGQAYSDYEVTGECTLYAKWTPNNYSVVYEHNTMGTGGAAAGNSDQCYTTPTWKTTGNPDYITYEQTGTYLDIPQTDHYTFEGWFTAPVGGTKIADSTGKVLVANAFAKNNTQLYAHWKPMYSGTYVYDEESLRNIGTSGTYHIVNDITMSNTWTPKDSFSGTIDGHGHTITGVVYKTHTSGTNTVIDYGFVRVLTGTIKNVTFNETNFEIIKSKDGQTNNNVGGVAGVLRGGTLENVTMHDPSVYSEHHRDVSASGSYSNARAGGLVGHMESGTIKNCSATGTGGVYTWAKFGTDRADIHAFSGGIVGYMTGGTVTGCSRGDSVKVSSASEVNGKNSATRCASGGIIGVRDGGTYSNCTSTKNNLIVSWKDTGSYSKDYSWKVTGEIVGRGG
jgi:uncharacterized repeat protein (TIGR02543 family)